MPSKTIKTKLVNDKNKNKKTISNILIVRFFTFLHFSGLSMRAFIFRVVDFIKQKIWEVLWSNSVALKPDVEWRNT